ncbi:hypothetical protein O77CONTIG1_02346 [Leptolyngbya sp. O-77]|nr:hypothetical protein O77CONTIG1_02346 [Leptolyngbya sp. O-77]
MQVRNLKWVATVFILGAITLTASKLGASTSEVTVQAPSELLSNLVYEEELSSVLASG